MEVTFLPVYERDADMISAMLKSTGLHTLVLPMYCAVDPCIMQSVTLMGDFWHILGKTENVQGKFKERRSLDTYNFGLDIMHTAEVNKDVFYLVRVGSTPRGIVHLEKLLDVNNSCILNLRWLCLDQINMSDADYFELQSKTFDFIETLPRQWHAQGIRVDTSHASTEMLSLLNDRQFSITSRGYAFNVTRAKMAVLDELSRSPEISSLGDIVKLNGCTGKLYSELTQLVRNGNKAFNRSMPDEIRLFEGQSANERTIMRELTNVQGTNGDKMGLMVLMGHKKNGKSPIAVFSVSTLLNSKDFEWCANVSFCAIDKDYANKATLVAAYITNKLFVDEFVNHRNMLIWHLPAWSRYIDLSSLGYTQVVTLDVYGKKYD